MHEMLAGHTNLWTAPSNTTTQCPTTNGKDLP